MNDPDLVSFENELRELRPAAASPELIQRLAATKPAPPRPPPARSRPVPAWGLLLRWLAPTTALALVALVAVLSRPDPRPVLPTRTTPTAQANGPDAVSVDRQLLGSFDTVVEFAGGQPVRFRCQEWEDTVVVHDPSRGLAIQRRTPRLELIPVRLEAY